VAFHPGHFGGGVGTQNGWGQRGASVFRRPLRAAGTLAVRSAKQGVTAATGWSRCGPGRRPRSTGLTTGAITAKTDDFEERPGTGRSAAALPRRASAGCRSETAAVPTRFGPASAGPARCFERARCVPLRRQPHHRPPPAPSRSAPERRRRPQTGAASRPQRPLPYLMRATKKRLLYARLVEAAENT